MFFHYVKNLLPEATKNRLRPFWYRFQAFCIFFKQGGRVTIDSDLMNWVASRPFHGMTLDVVVRSRREFYRWMGFGQQENSMHEWMKNLKNCKVFWDIGSANGLEGFYIHHTHEAHVVFFEPYTPSIETILKTIYRQSKRNKRKALKFDVVQALVGRETGWARMDIHEVPKPGQTMNSISDQKKFYAGGDRPEKDVISTQWLAKISLDDVFLNSAFQSPTHVKIDVDGLEIEVLKGAQKLLDSGKVQEWCVEVNDNNGDQVTALMGKSGYQKVAEYAHHPDIPLAPVDYIFKKSA